MPAGNETAYLSVTVDDAGVTLAGELDSTTAPDLRDRLLDLANDRPGPLVIDMEGVEFLDSSGINLLVECKKRLAATGSAVVLRRPAPCVTRVLEVTGLAEHFTVER